MTHPANTPPAPTTGRTFTRAITIDAPVAKVWQALTDPAIMKTWMAETEIEIITDWKVGAPIVIRGDLHGIQFENTGTVLWFEPGRLLSYSHLSSTSRLPHLTENFSVLEFALLPEADRTTLTVTLRNFPNEVIYKHLAFYWNVTPEILKRLLERPG